MLSFSSPITSLGPIAAKFAPILKKIGIETLENLLYHIPSRYVDLSNITPIKKLVPGDLSTIKGTVVSIEDVRSRWKHLFITQGTVQDETGTISCVWFHQKFVSKTLLPGTTFIFTGKVELDTNGFKFTHPEYEKILPGKELIHGGRIVPLYPLTQKITHKTLRFLIKTALQKTNVPEWLPSGIRSQWNLVGLKTALSNIHFPTNEPPRIQAEHRLKFDELFLLQLRNARARKELSEKKAPAIEFHEDETKAYVSSLPFKLTQSQKLASWEIVKDIAKPRPMNRLLSGDVGSGKTVVSSIPILNALLSGFQVAYMAPTEILAEQQFKTFCRLFEKQNFVIGLITSSGITINQQPNVILNSIQDPETNKKIKRPFSFGFSSLDSSVRWNDEGGEIVSKPEFLKKIAEGHIHLIVGTHSLIQKDVEFKNLGLVVVDEQHRFGVSQRQALTRRSTQIETQINADNGFLYEETTYLVRGAVFEVANKIGLGLKEGMYQNALEEALKQKNIHYEKEKNISVVFESKKVGNFRPDFVIDNKIIVELKALPFVGKIEEKQLWSYLKGSSYKLALLVNFGSKKLDIKRVVYDTARNPNSNNNQRPSAFYQRESASLPHFLSMTATPIPRTLALTVYGDLDISVINEMPRDRKPIATKFIAHEKRTDMYRHVEQEISNGRQAFVVCPLIDPSDVLGVKSANEELEKIKKIFPVLKAGILHGRQSAKQKNEVMKKFLEVQFDILVSTPVVEVGIDVQNASIMIIESAERFGLAQLHQLRGRVGRSEHQSTCYLLSDSESEATKKRLSAVIGSTNGLALAEKDLELRGPGDPYGLKQSGYEDTLYIARLTDFPVIQEAKEAAEQLLTQDPDLDHAYAVKKKVEELERKIHPE